MLIYQLIVHSAHPQVATLTHDDRQQLTATAVPECPERPCLPEPPDLDLSEESQQLATHSD